MVDTAPPTSGAQHLRYRAYVRVSFGGEEHRSKPATWWQLWKEGRGSSEAHRRDGKLLAVEHVDPNPGRDGETRPQVQLESARFDGFGVTWVPNPATGSPDYICLLQLPLNDFSHSNCVKGIPVRL